MADEPAADGKRWWQTLPGMLTAIAGVITAVTGLVVALHQIFPGSSGSSHATATTTAVTTSSASSEMSPAGSRAAYRVTFPAGTRARVGDAVYEILSARATGDNPGEVALDLSVRMTNNGRFAANFWDASFRLVVDGVSRAPTSGLDEIVDGRSAKEGTVSFVVPAAARRLVLRVGERDTVGLPVALRRTG